MATPAQYRGTGKRKTSVARVILRPGDGTTWFNGRTIEDYFPRDTHRKMVLAPLKVAGVEGTFDLRVRVHGGGPSGQAGATRHGIARALVEADPELRVSLKREGFLTRDARKVERKKAGLHKARKAPAVLQALKTRLRGEALPSPAVARKYFGTDGVRGVVGEFMTPELVERLGKASTLWVGDDARVFIGRDTRASGPELEQAFARGVVAAGGHAVLGGVVPTPAVALLRLDLGVVISASHNPPEYNGVKFFDRDGQKLVDAQEEEIEALFDAPERGGGSIDEVGIATDSYLEHVLERFRTDLSGLKIVVDSANGAYAKLAPKAFEQLGAEVHAIGDDPDGTNINVDSGATHLRALQQTVTSRGADLGVAFDGDGDRMLAVDARGNAIDGDAILAVLALHRRVDLVAVTVMTNLAFHELMSEHGIRVVTTDVGDRYVLEALRREGGILGGEQSGHIIWLDGHVTGDGLVAALLLCDALEGRTLEEAVSVLQPMPQVKRNVTVRTRVIPPELRAEIDALGAGNGGRVLVRPSGTEPVVRVLAEAKTLAEAENLCGTIAALVSRELG